MIPLTANGSRLMDEFATTMALKQKQKQEDEDRNNKILSTMRQMIATEEEEDLKKREKQVRTSLFIIVDRYFLMKI